MVSDNVTKKSAIPPLRCEMEGVQRPRHYGIPKNGGGRFRSAEGYLGFFESTTTVRSLGATKIPAYRPRVQCGGTSRFKINDQRSTCRSCSRIPKGKEGGELRSTDPAYHPRKQAGELRRCSGLCYG